MRKSGLIVTTIAAVAVMAFSFGAKALAADSKAEIHRARA